jgi:hypothetical protein
VESNDDQTNEKGAATMKLTTTTQVSADGVMQAPGGSDEDRRGGFERGGWAMGHSDEAMTFVVGRSVVLMHRLRHGANECVR